jgi:hypothetical protein
MFVVDLRIKYRATRILHEEELRVERCPCAGAATRCGKEEICTEYL